MTPQRPGSGSMGKYKLLFQNKISVSGEGRREQWSIISLATEMGLPQAELWEHIWDSACKAFTCRGWLNGCINRSKVVTWTTSKRSEGSSALLRNASARFGRSKVLLIQSQSIPSDLCLMSFQGLAACSPTPHLREGRHNGCTTVGR